MFDDTIIGGANNKDEPRKQEENDCARDENSGSGLLLGPGITKPRFEE